MLKHLPALVLLSVGSLTAAPEPINGVDFFETQIRPILAESCYSCHTQTMLGGLRLDSQEAMLKGGKSGPAVMPGNPDESLLIKVVRHQIEDMKMPMGGKLPEAQIASLAKWVEMGAPWPEAPEAEARSKGDEFVITPEQRKWWSFQDFEKTTPPQLKDKRVVNYIDSFVFAKLQENQIGPNEAADRRTLLRRISLDVIGLPPTPMEVEDFVNDKSPDAYEKVVDRLLASKQYGERWGRHWLDVVRYGEDDLHGIAKGGKGYEAYPQAYIYRDWVIKAFNDDMPYDKFVKAQIAADVMGKTDWEKKPRGTFDDNNLWGRLQVTEWDNLTEEQRRELIPSGHVVNEELDKELLPALGFQGAGPWYYDLGDAWVMRADERNDRVDVVTRGFLGLTVACARCHDHKYDPISAKDYYSMAGVFFNSPYHEYPLADQAVVDHWLEKDELVEQQKERMGDFLKAEGELLAERMAYQAKDYMVAAWKVTGEPKQNIVTAAYDGKLDVEILQRWIDFLAKEPKHYPYLVEWQTMIEHGGNLLAAENMAENFQETLLRVMAEYKKIDERNDKIEVKAWPLDDKPPIPSPNKFKTSFEKYFIEKDTMDRVRINLYTDVFRFDLSATTDLDGNPGRRAGLLSFKDWGLEKRLTAESQDHLARLKEDMKKLEKWRGKQYPFAMGVRETDVITELPLHKRGSPTDLGDPVERRFLEVLSSEDGPKLFEKGSGRLELAESIVSHPLAARVIVNRVWKWHFGTGIVDTPSNFGRVGDKPSHPQMLDYMAQRFVDNGMSIKQLHRDILLSHTYRQTSAKNEMAFQKDPQNRLYWRFSRQRLDAEQIRDSLLFVSGVLDTKEVGGPSGDIDSPKLKRRAVYGTVSRFLMADFHKTFDFPNPSISADQRYSTSVPLQRLFFMNSELVTDLAGKFAERTNKPLIEPEKDEAEESKDKKKGAKGKKAEEPVEVAEKPKVEDKTRIERAYMILYGRQPTDEETAAGIGFLSDEKNQKKDDDYSEEPVTAWKLYARALLSSNEFLFMN